MAFIANSLCARLLGIQRIHIQRHTAGMASDCILCCCVAWCEGHVRKDQARVSFEAVLNTLDHGGPDLNIFSSLMLPAHASSLCDVPYHLNRPTGCNPGPLLCTMALLRGVSVLQIARAVSTRARMFERMAHLQHSQGPGPRRAIEIVSHAVSAASL